MRQRQASSAAGKDHKKELLHAVYDVYSRWVERFPLVCQKGCADCCTQSVTMTSLEGEMILDFVKRRHREKWLIAKLAQAYPGNNRTTVTTNQFAGACLNQQEVDEDTLGSWDFTPCVFLEHAICSIYEVRPFGCRSFGSVVRCAADRSAEMPPIHLAVNTALTQVIEHIDSDGGYWANMTDILHGLAVNNSGEGKMHLLPARPVPGFLLEPREMHVVKVLLQQLRKQFSEKGIFGDLIDNFLTI